MRPKDPEGFPHHEEELTDTAATRTVEASSLEQAPDPELEAGTLIGRYVLKEMLGRGGMGVVYRAHDPDLSRDVAIKLLRVRASGDATSRRLRLVREAQALAKLSHPNIVAVHDVGTFEDGVFIAMEFVEGRTLQRLVREDNPSFAATMRMLLDAGRGLAAAHAVGLVHRDVKPDNILVGQDGRARVGDFGLARSVETGAPRRPSAPLASGERPLARADALASTGSLLSSGDVTQAGAFMGTPQYMSPEQFRGEAPGAASDQFSFCVTAFEALYGARPFRGLTLGDLAMRVTAGDPPAIPKSSRVKVPRRVLRALVRGLSADPRERHASLSDLLDDLGRDPLPALRLSAALALSLAVGLGVASWKNDDGAVLCETAGSRSGEVWNAAAKASLERAFLATNKAHAADTFVRVSKTLDGYAARYRAARQHTCEATHVRGEQSGALLDRRMTCLDRQLDRMSALVRLLSHEVDGPMLDRAVTSVQALPSATECERVSVGPRSAQVPASQARESEAVYRGLATAHALSAAARYDEALANVRALSTRAQRLSDPTLQAEVERLHGGLLAEVGEPQAAEVQLGRALASAVRARDVRREALVSVDLFWNVGYNQARHKEALAMQPFVQAAVARTEDGEAEAKLATTLCLIRWAQGEYAAARAHGERALALGRMHGMSDGERALQLNNLGLVINDAGDPEAALEVYGESLALMEQTFGAGHPHVAMVLNNRGNAHNDREAYEQARGDFERSLSVWEAALGPNHGDLSYPLTNLGAILTRLGRPAEAALRLERALALDEEFLGPNHVEIAFTLTSLADAYYEQGKLADARVAAERALSLRQKNDVPSMRLAETMFILGKIVHAQKDREKARHLMADMERTLGEATEKTALDLRARKAAWLARHAR